MSTDPSVEELGQSIEDVIARSQTPGAIASKLRLIAVNDPGIDRRQRQAYLLWAADVLDRLALADEPDPVKRYDIAYWTQVSPTRFVRRTGYVESNSESGARQAWIDGDVYEDEVDCVVDSDSITYPLGIETIEEHPA